MKYVIYIVLAVALCSVSFADVSLYSLKIYANDVYLPFTNSDTDVTTQDATTVQFQMRFENTYNTPIDVSIKGTLFDIDNDLVRSTTITVPANDKKPLVLEYYIPDNTPLGAYEWHMEYKYSYNGTNYNSTKEVTVHVQKPVLDQNEVIVNLTRSILETKQQNTDLMLRLENLSKLQANYTQCVSDLSSIRALNNLSNECAQNYATLNSLYLESSSNLSACRSQILTYYTPIQYQGAIDTAKVSAKNEQSANDTKFMFAIGGIFVIYIYLTNKYKRVGGLGTGEPIRATKWK